MNDMDRLLVSDDQVSLNDVALGRAHLFHPDDVAVVRRTDDETIIGYVVRTDIVREVSPHPFVAEQPSRVACLLFVGPDRVCGRPADHPAHTGRIEPTTDDAGTDRS